MSEVKKIATRESYGNALVEIGKENPNLVVLDADLAAATKTGMFKKAFPERHIDCGIAEVIWLEWQQDFLTGKDSFYELLCHVCSRTCF